MRYIEMLKKQSLMEKKETIHYFIDTETMEILDENKRFVYCNFHIDQRIYMDKNGFMQCNECIKRLGARS